MYKTLECIEVIRGELSENGRYHLQALANSIRELEGDKGDVESLESDVSEMKDTVEGLESTVGDIESTIEDLDDRFISRDWFDLSDFGGISSEEVGALEEEFRHHVHELEDKNDSIREDVDTLESKTDDLEYRLDDLESNSEEFDSKLEESKAWSGTLIESLESKLDRFESRLSKFKDDSYWIDSRLCDIEGGEIESFLVCQSRVYELEDKVSGLEVQLAEKALKIATLEEYLNNCISIIDSRLSALETSDY